MEKISTSRIKELLSNKQFYEIIVEEKVSSTNDVLKNMADDGGEEGVVLIAKEQTSGKGRLGRSFYSPADTGIYMSILVKPDKNAEKSLIITSAAAVAVCKAIRSVAKVKANIKWVNDIIIDNKKVCGILTEGKINSNDNKLEYAVVGIGINIIKPVNGFPNDISSTATVLLEKEENIENKLIAKILDNFYFYYNDIDLFDDVIRYDYISLCDMIGNEINVIENDSVCEAKAIGIAEDMSLIIRDENGIRNITNGEISIRIK